jgi:hypothetical protein
MNKKSNIKAILRSFWQAVMGAQFLMCQTLRSFVEELNDFSIAF